MTGLQMNMIENKCLPNRFLRHDFLYGGVDFIFICYHGLLRIEFIIKFIDKVNNKFFESCPETLLVYLVLFTLIVTLDDGCSKACL